MLGSFHKTKEVIQRIFMGRNKKWVANNKISAHNKAIATVETIVTLLFYYHRQQCFVSLSVAAGIRTLSLSLAACVCVCLSVFPCAVQSNIDNCVRADSESIPGAVLCHSVYYIFSRSFDICRSIENLFYSGGLRSARCIKQIAGVQIKSLFHIYFFFHEK